MLRAKLEASKPDVILLFGDDQSEQFCFNNYPALAVFAGNSFSGFKVSPKFGISVPDVVREQRPKTSEHWTQVSGHPQFARELIVGLMRRHFDVSFSLSLPRPDEGIGHAFMRPLLYLTPHFDIPTVPVFVNCYYGPQPTGRRCAEFGMAVRNVIESMPAELNVALVGSGGLWHMPLFPEADLDESFDEAILNALTSGDANEMATFFDSRNPALDPNSPGNVNLCSGGTGMVLGYGGGTGETRNWIIVTGAMDGIPGTVVDYVPAYASPIGLAFAHW